MKVQQIKVTLFGKAGTRHISVTANGILPTRHIKARREIPGAPPPVDTPPPTTPDAPLTLLEVIRFMHASPKHNDWLILDEILRVATTEYQMKFNHTTLLNALREEFKQGHLEHKLNRFDQHTFRLIESD